MIETLIFDLDGTLVDTLPDITQSVNFAFKNAGLAQKSKEEVKGNIGLGIENLIDKCLKQSKTKPKLGQEPILKEFKQHYLDHCTDFSKVYTGVTELLDKIQHLKLAILTNKPMIYTQKILKHYGLLPFFSSIIAGDSTQDKKPGTTGIEKIFHDLKVDSKSCIMIGDSVADVQTAQKTGVLSLGIQGGIGDPIALKQSQPDFLVNHFFEVQKILDNLNLRQKVA